MKPKGTLEDWVQGIGRYCVGNALLAFAVSIAFAAVLLRLAGEGSGGFHFRGTTSSGKSTIARMAASVWARATEFLCSWNTTVNAIEETAREHCDGLLVLDELELIDPHLAGGAAYTISNETGKNRSNQGDGNRPRKKWRTLFISNGEISLAQHMTTAGKVVRGGQDIRLLDIPADAGKDMGVFETLHGFETPDTLARHLNSAADEFFGTPIRAFIPKVVENRDVVIAELKRSRADFLKANVPSDASGEIFRAAGRFALVATAGELATRWEILPWPPGEANRAAVVCFSSWLSNRGGVGSSDAERAIAQIRSFIAGNASMRFADFESPQRSYVSIVGYRRKRDGLDEFLVLSDSFRQELCKGFDSKMVAKELANRLLLLPGTEGKMTTKVTLPDGTRTPVYRILSAILSEE